MNKTKYILLGIVIGILIVGSISVYAVTAVIEGSEVSYNNQTSKGSYTNVQGSIDELYQRYKDLTGETSTKYTESILNGADPVLRTGMIPVTIDGDGKVKYANVNTPWYKYAEKRWANAVILVSGKTHKVGDTIPESDIAAYFVWIPRYSYKIWDLGNYTGYQSSSSLVDNADAAAAGGETAFRRVTKNAHLIDIQFGASKTDTGTAVGQYHTNEAFTVFGVKGLWVGKFEVTGSINAITVKPGIASVRNQTVGAFWNALYSYNRTLDSHMMKNTEWGAVAYLSHSVYGIGNEININNNSNYLTGYSAGANIDQSSYTGKSGTTEPTTYTYNTPAGYLASTTGNITGVYDMSGGAHEYMASYMDGYAKQSLGGVSSDVTDIEIAKSQYFDKYSKSSTATSFNQRKLGDATGEMGPFYYYYDKDKNRRSHNAWYADLSYFVDSTTPWFYRGGAQYYGALAGQFDFNRDTGGVNISIGSRLILAVK